MTQSHRYCLNTSTIQGQKLTLVDEVKLAAEAGFDAIEPWIGEIIAYRQAGGSLADLKKRLADSGLAVPSAIGFAKWIVNDPAERKAGLEEARRDFELVARLGGTGIAAPPAGVQQVGGVEMIAAAQRYAELIDLGSQFGVVPMLEVWGFSRQLATLPEAICIAAAANRSAACLLLDIYHLYKGGGGHGGLHLLGSEAVRVFHMNDYPAPPDRTAVQDSDRVWPGDGTAPTAEIVAQLRRIGFHGWFSLELFNPAYWKMDPREAVRIGLEKMKKAVEGAQVT